MVSARALRGHDARGSNQEQAGCAWWRDDEKHMGSAMSATVKAILDDQGDYAERDQRHLSMYRGRSVGGSLAGINAMVLPSPSSMRGPKMAFALTRSVCNTVVSGIAKNRPKVSCATDGASREMRQKARDVEQYIGGAFEQTQTYRVTPRAFLDSLWHGTGVVYAWHDGKDLVTERVFPPEFVVDRHEGQNWAPRNGYRLIPVDRDFLASQKWERASREDIENQNMHWGEDQYVWWRDERMNRGVVYITVGWHLPDAEGGNGRMVVSYGDLTLDVKEWKLDRLPFGLCRWTWSPNEFRGVGLAEEGAPLQAEANRLGRAAQAAMFLLSHPYIVAEKSSGLVKGHLAGIPGAVLQHNAGTRPPNVMAPSVVHPEVFSHMDRIIKLYYELGGVSQMSANATLPARMESGRAQLVLRDTQSQRFAMAEREFENLHLDIADLHISAGKEINYEVKVFDAGNGFQRMKWSDIDMDRDAFVLRRWPTSLMADSPAGRLDNVERLMKMGLAQDPLTQLELLDSPDLQKYTNRVLGSRRYIEKLIEGILYEGKPSIMPDPALPPEEALTIATDMYLEGLSSGEASRDGLTKLANWIIAARQLALAGPPGGAAAGPPPPAGPVEMPPGPPVVPPGGPALPGMPPEMPPMPM